MATTTPVAQSTTTQTAPVQPATTTAPAKKAAPAPIRLGTDGRRLIDMQGFMNILSKRITVTSNMIGQQLVLSVQGNGQFLARGFEYTGPMGKTENQFDRYIYNLVANSQLSMQRVENRTLLLEATKAESAGDYQLAHDLFNDYLNAVQISFSVIDNPGSAQRRFEAGDRVKATVSEVLNAAGQRQLVVDNVRYMAPVVVSATKFSITDLLGIDDDGIVL